MKSSHLALVAILTLTLFFSTNLFAQCVPDTTVPNVPGIYPEVLPPATGCQYYEVDVTAVFPRDTVTPLGTFPFDRFTIDSIIGLPPGMQWECNLAPNCVYITHPDSVMADTLGCIRLFGTPTVPATYNLQAWVTADLIAFGQTSPQALAFQVPLTVSPCEFVGDCYTLSLSGNCEPTTLSLVNEIPSNGQQGFAYDWQINGPNGYAFSSTDEQPADQILPDGGTYVVEYLATVDTLGFLLNQVTIDSTDCNDLLGGPGDLYWILIDPNGTELVNTMASPIDGGTDSLPLVTGITGIFLDSGTYEFQVWDDDSFIPLDSPDGCATGANGSGASVFFTIPPPNTGNNVVTVDGLRVIFDIANPIDSISCSDTLEIGSLPETPALLIEGDTVAVSDYTLCERDTLFLETMSTDSLQWFVGDSAIAGANAPILPITEAGNYRVEAIDRDNFCLSTSSTLFVSVASIATPSIFYDGMGNLTINNPNPSYTYEWYQPFIGLAGTGTSFSPTASGDYTAVAFDPITGCRSLASSSRNVIVTSLPDLMSELTDIRLFPNPSPGTVYLEMEFSHPQQSLSISLFDLTGRKIFAQSRSQVAGIVKEKIEAEFLTSGLYLLSIQTENGVLQRKIVIQKE